MMNPKDYMNYRDDEDNDIIVEEQVDDEDEQVVEEGEFKDYLVESSEPYIVINESRYHKSNLVNSVLNNKTKLTGSRLLRVCEVKSTTKFDEVIEASEEQFRVSDTVAVVYKIKQTKDFVIIFVCVDKITWKTKIQSSVPLEKLNECTLNGKILMFDDILNDELK